MGDSDLVVVLADAVASSPVVAAGGADAGSGGSFGWAGFDAGEALGVGGEDPSGSVPVEFRHGFIVVVRVVLILGCG